MQRSQRPARPFCWRKTTLLRMRWRCFGCQPSSPEGRMWPEPLPSTPTACLSPGPQPKAQCNYSNQISISNQCQGSKPISRTSFVSFPFWIKIVRQNRCTNNSWPFQGTNFWTWTGTKQFFSLVTYTLWGQWGRVILGQCRGYKISTSLALSGQEEDNDHKGHRHQPLWGW